MITRRCRRCRRHRRRRFTSYHFSPVESLRRVNDFALHLNIPIAVIIVDSYFHWCGASVQRDCRCGYEEL